MNDPSAAMATVPWPGSVWAVTVSPRPWSLTRAPAVAGTTSAVLTSVVALSSVEVGVTDRCSVATIDWPPLSVAVYRQASGPV